MLAVPGVARITVYGGEQREVQILLDPARLAAADLALTDVLNAARGRHRAYAAPGRSICQSQRIPISTGLVGDPVQIVSRAVVVDARRVTVLIGDVAEVQEGAAIAFGDAVIQGGEVYCWRSRASTARTRSRSRARSRALAEELRRGCKARGIEVFPGAAPPGIVHRNRAPQSARTLAIGALLIAIVLYRVPARLAFGADRVPGDSVVAARRGRRARPFQSGAEHADARRIRGGARRARRRRGHLPREYSAAPARERRAAAPRGASRSSFATRRSKSRAPSSSRPA